MRKMKCPTSGKVGHGSEAEATSAAARAGAHVHTYFCLYCESYHLTSAKPKR